MGILTFVWVVAPILALILGRRARRQIDDVRVPAEMGRRMASAGIVLGWVGIGLLLATFAILGAAAG